MRLQAGAVGFDNLFIEISGILWDALLGGIVDIDDAEALPVALGPFKVIQEGPLEIPAQVNTVCRGAAILQEVAVEEVFPVGVGVTGDVSF